MKVVILGSGRVGARLAQLMEAEGHDVSIIDGDTESFARLPDGFKGQTILGTGIDVDVLKAADIMHADAFAAVTNFDNTNIMACQVAKEIFGVKKVLARIYDPGREQLYHELGLETICPTTLISTTSRDILLAAEGVEVLNMPPHVGGPQLGVTPFTPVTPARQNVTNSQPANPGHDHSQPQNQFQQSTETPGEQGPINGRGLRGIFKH